MKKTLKVSGIIALMVSGLAVMGCAGLDKWLAGQPKPELAFSPEYFSPDGDGVDDELSITLRVKDGFADSWSFDIYWPDREGQERRVFKHFESNPGDERLGYSREVVLTWNGEGDPVERPRRNAQPGDAPRTVTPKVQSATNYPFVFTAKTSLKDEEGNVTELDIKPYEGEIPVDILISQMDDGRRKIQVGSIVFRSGAADFNKLPERTVRMNNYTVSRIAAALNKFSDYKVTIEGHANPEYAPGTPERAKEDADEAKPGSVSEKRAQAILELLVKDGVSAERLTAVGVGTAKPVIDFEDKENATQNRRVEFYLER